MITFIIKSSISLIVLFGLYWFLLRQEKLFVFNRVFLIFSVIFSLSLPFISIPVDIQELEPQVNLLTTISNAIPIYNSEQNTLISPAQSSSGMYLLSASAPEGISYTQILIMIYILGIFLLSVRFIRNIFSLFRHMRISEKITYSGYRLVLTKNQINPFCFFNTIFVSKQDYLSNNIAEELLSHEVEHIKQSHTIDVIFIELIKIVYWFNPIFILYSRAIRVNHEYLADNAVTRGSSDIKSYAEKLISYIGTKRNIPLTSGLNPSLTRKRLLMLTKSRSGLINYGTRIFITLTLFAVLVMVLSFTPSYSQVVKHQQETGGLNNFNQKHEEKTNNDGIEITIKGRTTEIKGDDSDKKVTYNASGEIKLDTINQIIVLTDNATIIYNEITIKADSIAFNKRKNQIYATGRRNSSGSINNNPIFKEGSREIEADEITYNLITRKAVATNIKAHVNTKPKDTASINMESIHTRVDKFTSETSNTTERPELFPIKKGEYSDISRTFGEKRIKLNSKTDTVIFHYGIDINAKAGIDVFATAGGNVINASWENGDNWDYGRLIVIDHGDGCQSLYSHLNDFTVKIGDIVKKGQIIGHVGSSGISTGAHLHFEIRLNGERVDPLTYLK